MVRLLSTSTPPLQQNPALRQAQSLQPEFSTSTLYGDSVPIGAKEKVMDKVYCKVADRYDFNLGVLSLGMNKMWKQKFVRSMAPAAGQNLLDVAGGTCEIAKHFLDYQDDVNGDKTSAVHVVDLNEQMLRVGQGRLADSQWMLDGRVTFAQGNAEDLADIADNSIDIYCISAGMHNLPHPEAALSEAYRVVRPGGRFACLEYGHVDMPVLGSVCRWYMDNAVPALGQLVAGDSASYERLAHSVRTFPHQRDFAKAIRRAGFCLKPGPGYELFQWGMMVAYFGTKPE
ncbi:hypothetical protein GGI04_000452 [Coemansia thaxteri]|nr:hypothetical protein GGI04_000452 [Coemansia thaxteri]